jgi:hypothetical protein
MAINILGFLFYFEITHCSRNLKILLIFSSKFREAKSHEKAAAKFKKLTKNLIKNKVMKKQLKTEFFFCQPDLEKYSVFCGNCLS